MIRGRLIAGAMLGAVLVAMPTYAGFGTPRIQTASGFERASSTC